MNALATYLYLLHGVEAPGALAELRWKLPHGGMGRAFHDCRDRAGIAREVITRAPGTDIYIGVAPRSRAAGGKDAVERVHVAWVDLDTPEAIAGLSSFEPGPSMTVCSGSGLHAYWSLWPPVGPDEAEIANRRLVHRLDGDPRAVDAARILRPPGSFNHKTGSPVPVTVDSVRVDIFTVEDVVGALPDPPARHEADGDRPVVRLHRDHEDDPLRELSAVEYVEALTGRRPGRDGKLLCPLHQERTPSFHAYPDPAEGWACFGCEAPAGRDALGGDIYTFAALLWGYPMQLRDDDFLEVRLRLLEELTR